MSHQIEQQRFCVFRSGTGWFGLPALSIAQVTTRPQLTPVPGSDSALAGLARVRNEFVPAFSFASITMFDEAMTCSEDQLVVINSVAGSWGLLVDQTIDVVALETSLSALANQEDHWSRVSAGSASYKDQVLQVLEPDSLLQYAVSRLEAFWKSAPVLNAESTFDAQQLIGELV
ncbi:MAG: chemotaxis protein CheW [Planctomycetota bacterium]